MIQVFLFKVELSIMSIEIKPKTPLSEIHQWFEQAIEQNNIRYFDYSNFKDFEFLGAGVSGKVEKAIYDFAKIEIPYALKTIFYLQDANIGKKELTKFIKEASLYSSRLIVIIC